MRDDVDRCVEHNTAAILRCCWLTAELWARGDGRAAEAVAASAFQLRAELFALDRMAALEHALAVTFPAFRWPDHAHAPAEYFDRGEETHR